MNTISLKPLFAFIAAAACLALALPAAAQTTNSPSSAYTFTTFAGFSSTGSADGVGSFAQFNLPEGVAVDTNTGNIFVTDSGNHTIRKITPAGVVSTIAGFPSSPGSDDGTNSSARFNQPAAIAIDSSGTFFIADTGNNTIRKMVSVGTNWVVTTIAGQVGVRGTNDGLGANAQFFIPCGIAVDRSDHITVIDDSLTQREGSLVDILASATVRLIVPSGTNWNVTTRYNEGNYRDFEGHFGVTVDSSGSVYVPNVALTKGHGGVGGPPGPPAGQVLKIAGATVTVLAGNSTSANTDGTGASASFGLPNGITFDTLGNLYIADSYFAQIRKLTPSGNTWIVSTLAGSGFSGVADGTGTSASFGLPEGLAADAANNLYVADSINNSIRQVSSAGVVHTLAGASGNSGSTDGVGIAARFNNPQGIVGDKFGNLYISDSGNETIRKITSAGEVQTLAGTPGTGGSSNGVGGNALFNNPVGLAVDNAGNLYVTDSFNYTLRKITPAGIVTTIVGAPGVGGNIDGSGTTARLNFPEAVTIDAAGILFVADTGVGTIRKISPSGNNWVVTTIAGTFGSTGTNDGVGTSAQFGFPNSICVDAADNLYVTDSDRETIRMIKPSVSAGVTNWTVSTIAGNPATNSGFADGIGRNALFSGPSGITVDRNGNLFVADTGNNAIRKLTPFAGSLWAVSTVGGPLAGNPGSADGAGGAALFNGPVGITVDASGNLFIADSGNNTIRKGVFTAFSSVNTVGLSSLPVVNGRLTVTLLPPEANGQWRFPWEVTWHNSGFTANNLTPGSYPVEFRNLPGWLAIPPALTITNPVVIAPATTVHLTNNYFPTISPADANAASGSLTVYLGANPPNGAGWRFLGDTTPFFASNFTTNLVAGTYLIQFAGPFSGRATPPNASVQIASGVPTFISVNYPFASAPPPGVLLPVPVPSVQIGDLADFPFGFNGQLQTDVGFGSGVVVQTNVVLTAAHLVFDDTALGYVSGAYWFLAEDAPLLTPSPETARGFYLLSGYAGQRTNDLSSGIYGPDVSSPQSRNLDVAALYFQSPVANGVFNGYLPSDAVPNQWLSGTAEKMLVGYPVDGSQFGFANIVPGQMYQIGPQPYPLTLSPDSVTNQQEVYTASWFLSYPGNSGGPLYVQLNNYFYPAGVYLGTLNGQSVVRGIDSNVVNLITQAAILGDAGTNNNGGGVITIIPNAALSAFNPGYLQIQLGPPSAVQDGAAWLLQPGTTFSTATNFTQAVFSTNAVALQFKPIPGWLLPTNQSVVVTPGLISHPSALYTVLPPALVPGPQGLGLKGAANTSYRIKALPL